jgi:hypothetical protein
MENYVKVFELFDKRNIVYKNASVDKIEGQSQQPYTQTINYFFTFDEAKKKISSIWEFSTPRLDKKNSREVRSTQGIKKLRDLQKSWYSATDKVGKSIKKELGLTLSSLGISEKKQSNQLFYYIYDNLRMAKIEFDRTKVHDRSWKMTFYYYDGVNGEEKADEDKTPKKEPKLLGYSPIEKEKQKENSNKREKNDDVEKSDKNKELDYKKNKQLDYKEEEKIEIPYFNNFEEVVSFLNKNKDKIKKVSNNEIKLGDLKIVKDSNKKTIIYQGGSDNDTLEIVNLRNLKTINSFFDIKNDSDDDSIMKFSDYHKPNILVKYKNTEYTDNLENVKKEIKDLELKDKNKILNKIRKVISTDTIESIENSILSKDKKNKINDKFALLNSINKKFIDKEELEVLLNNKNFSKESLKILSKRYKVAINYKVSIRDIDVINIFKSELDSIIKLSKKEVE